MEPSSNHLRENILTGQWVIYAPKRAKRPKHPESPKPEKKDILPEKESHCPFCPGNENMIPEVSFELKAEKNDKWFTRVVPNKYPALTTEGQIKTESHGIHSVTTAFGRHEVVIESPFHNQDIPLMPSEQVERVLETYLRRYEFLRNNFKDISNIIIFRNHGPASGTSLVHPHSQIIGTGVIPRYILDKETIAENYFEKKGRCPLCDIIEFEKHEGQRSIYENGSFLGFVPFASEVPFEVWITPKKHCPDFSDIGKSERKDLADALRDILLRFHDKLDSPGYNYIIHSRPVIKEPAPYSHWYLQIRPRTTTPAGFEIGSGMHINPSLPEQDAGILRE